MATRSDAFSGLGVLAMVVAMLGIYSTTSYGVAQRTHEFGVRMALGARVGDVVRQVLGEGLRTVATGVALGVLFRSPLAGWWLRCSMGSRLAIRLCW